MRASPQRRRPLAVAVLTAASLVLPATLLAAPAQAAESGPVAEYLFTQSAGTSVANTATGAQAANPATVINPAATSWTGTSLVFPGGAKNSASATWVRLPDDLLKAKNSATITTEVRLDTSMKSSYNFLWNFGNDASQQYFFASVKDAPRSAITVSSAGGEANAPSGSNLQADRWYSLTTVLDGASKSLSFYVDGAKVGSTTTSLTPASIADQSLNAIGRSPWPDPFFKGQVSAFRVYDRALSEQEVGAAQLQDAQLNQKALKATADGVVNALTMPPASITSDYVALPAAGGQVTWASSSPDVIATDGSVTQPAAGQPAKSVTLTATATVRGISSTRSATVQVEPASATEAERDQDAALRYVVPPVLASGEALPKAPSGLSVKALSATGATLEGDALTTSGSETVEATVTVEVTRAGGSAVERTFPVSVLPADQSTSLLAYQRTPTSDQQANNADVALSLHLALQGKSGWTPLNENYGIFFPTTSTTVPAGGTSDSILRSLKNPSVFALADGGYGVIGTRVARGGGSDGTQAHSVLIATSPDLRTFTEVGLLRLDDSGGVNRPTAIYDAADKSYRLSWTTDSGTGRSQSVNDVAQASKARAAGVSVSGRSTAPLAVDTAADIENFVPGTSLTISTSDAAALEQRFGRVKNTGVKEYAEVHVPQGTAVDSASLPGAAELEYSDGSAGTLPVESWDTSAVDTSTPGEYTATGTVKQTSYPTPFSDERADPSVFKFDFNGTDKYLMIATNDIYGDNVFQQNQAFMPVRMADTISGLADTAGAKEVKLLKRGDLDARGQAMTGCFWAPEFHLINGKLSILFMPCYGSSPDMWKGRASIMQLKQDASGADLDPTVPANWTLPEQVLRQDGKDLNLLAGISLDMTYFEDESGQAYYAWQQLGAIFIATMDPSDPTRLTSAPVRIVVPEYAWDNTIAEGPNVLSRDGKLYLIYSGSTVGDSYTTGLATADASGASDLLDPASWSKLNYPIQKSGIFNGAWQLGTGHGMWSEDEDGNLIYVFHARTDHNGLSGRDMFVRRVHFDAENMPIFDMEPTEELAKPTVSLRVIVDPAETDAEAEADADAGAEAEAGASAEGTANAGASDSGTSDGGTDGATAGTDADAGAGAGASSAADGDDNPAANDDATANAGAASDAGSDTASDGAGSDADGAQGGTEGNQEGAAQGNPTPAPQPQPGDGAADAVDVAGVDKEKQPESPLAVTGFAFAGLGAVALLALAAGLVLMRRRHAVDQGR